MLPERLDERCQPAVIDNRLASSGGVEVNRVDNALEARILPGHGPNGVSKDLAKSRGLGCDVWPPAFGRHIEPNELVVLINDRPGSLGIPDLLGDPVDLIIENVREALEKDQRKDVILELGGIEWSPDLAGGIPQPAFERLEIQISRMRAPVRVRPPSCHGREEYAITVGGDGFLTLLSQFHPLRASVDLRCLDAESIGDPVKLTFRSPRSIPPT